MKILPTFSLCFIAGPLVAQVNTSELRLKVIDSTGLGLKATVSLTSQANQYFSELTTDADGSAKIERLAYGVYRLDVEKQGFSPISNTLAIRSAIPVEQTLQLAIAPINTVIRVSDAGTLLDPNRPSSIMQIGSAQIEDRVALLSGRSVQDLVNSQPGWQLRHAPVLRTIAGHLGQKQSDRYLRDRPRGDHQTALCRNNEVESPGSLLDVLGVSTISSFLSFSTVCRQ
ncbi:carboxypeptidase-like regulatory domain-containing protein [Tunturiibacter gelidiferens]|uniref:carboxypeptidase-like regulatory domain-containing protein n=1 Tax=Tunturiibacter gelidiferens TaxID=3069689 RepID=UPI003D9B62BE